jgi:hypothetical protein
MDTNLTVEQIQVALYNSTLFNKRQDIMIPNLSYGLLDYEADFVSISKSGYLTEVEIKRSFEDFKADFKKKHNHNDFHVYYFYYCIPESIFNKVNKYLQENQSTKAILTYDENGFIFNKHIGFSRNYNGRKLFIEEQLKVARLGCLRMWNLKEKNIKK